MFCQGNSNPLRLCNVLQRDLYPLLERCGLLPVSMQVCAIASSTRGCAPASTPRLGNVSRTLNYHRDYGVFTDTCSRQKNGRRCAPSGRGSLLKRIVCDQHRMPPMTLTTKLMAK